MVDCWIRQPCFACVSEMTFETTPFVPLQGTVGSEKNERKHDDDGYSDLGSLEQVVSEVVNYRRVHLVAETQGVLWRNWQESWIERDALKSVVDIRLEQLKGGIDATR
jgi:hypothetical protein